MKFVSFLLGMLLIGTVGFHVAGADDQDLNARISQRREKLQELVKSVMATDENAVAAPDYIISRSAKTKTQTFTLQSAYLKASAVHGGSDDISDELMELDTESLEEDQGELMDSSDESFSETLDLGELDILLVEEFLVLEYYRSHLPDDLNPEEIKFFRSEIDRAQFEAARIHLELDQHQSKPLSEYRSQRIENEIRRVTNFDDVILDFYDRKGFVVSGVASAETFDVRIRLVPEGTEIYMMPVLEFATIVFRNGGGAKGEAVAEEILGQRLLGADEVRKNLAGNYFYILKTPEFGRSKRLQLSVTGSTGRKPILLTNQKTE